MIRYLLDTNICIYYLKGQFNLGPTLDNVGFDQCAISEITVAEMKYGIAKRERPEALRKLVDNLISRLTIIGIFDVLDLYAAQKTKLRRAGLIFDDFDILIGATAIHHSLTMVTNNIAHFSRLESIELEDWVTR